MFRNMVTSLFKYDRIRTTDVKAKALRKWADNIVTLAKRGDLHARRQVLAIIREKNVVHKLFEDAKEKFGDRAGGYTRIVKIGRRPGDAAPISLIELISNTPAESKKKTGEKDKAKSAEEKKSVPAEKIAAPAPAAEKQIQDAESVEDVSEEKKEE